MVNIPKDELNNELEFIFQNNLENGVSEDEALESVVDNLAERLSSLNVPQEFIQECSKFVVDDYKEGLADRQTPIEAFNSAMENFHQKCYPTIRNDIQHAPQSGFTGASYLNIRIGELARRTARSALNIRTLFRN